jgi:hypothetical protein
MSRTELHIVSPLEKPFWDDNIKKFKPLTRFSLLRGELGSFTVVYAEQDPAEKYSKRTVFIRINGSFPGEIEAARIDDLPVRMPVYKDSFDDGYIRTTPGLYPDLLVPVTDKTQLYVVPGETKALWIDAVPDDDAPAGSYTLNVSLVDRSGAVIASSAVTIEVLPAKIPPRDFTVTEWFYADCLAVRYNVPVFSEEHWRIIGNFIKTAVKNGINMLLTPVFTPPLDTAVGGERPTVQLVDVCKNGGEWSFAYPRFDRWVALADSLGVEKFEISHFFTQWGAKHAPKIIATVDGVEQRVFGWETDSHGEEYAGFLHAFLSDFLPHLEKLGIKDRCVWHVSDEPHFDALDSYRACKETLQSALGPDAYIMDALSNIEFYKTGAVDHPIPGINHIRPFLEAKVPGLWTYYCCSQNVGVTNRFIAGAGSRTRIAGVQFWKYDIKGFLQWGYNFWFNQYSISPVDPFICTDGEYFAPAGDAFSVLPAPDGTAYETLHLRQFTAGLEDLRALRLCESLVGREKTLAALEEVTGEITFTSYPLDPHTLIAARERINALIKEALS